MHLRDESLFTADELIRAFSLFLPPEQAAREACLILEAPSVVGFDAASPQELAQSEVRGPPSFDGDLLVLLSLVSADCARRAWAHLGVSEEVGQTLQRELATKLGLST